MTYSIENILPIAEIITTKHKKNDYLICTENSYSVVLPELLTRLNLIPFHPRSTILFSTPVGKYRLHKDRSDLIHSFYFINKSELDYARDSENELFDLACKILEDDLGILTFYYIYHLIKRYNITNVIDEIFGHHYSEITSDSGLTLYLTLYPKKIISSSNLMQVSLFQ